MSAKNNQRQIEASKLSLPKGGGAIQGVGETFQANEFSGTAGLSLPVFASPCRDFAPQLNLSYSSGNGNGNWGMGFDMSLPKIRRQTRLGTPRYQDTDVFVLSGSTDLVPLNQTPSREVLQGTTYTIQTFAPRQEGLFALIEYWQAADTSQSFWKVTSPDHTISIFGKTAQAKIIDPNNPSHVFTWLLEESYNTTGDHQLFLYKQENTDNVPKVIYEQGHTVTANRYIERIQYGNEKPVADSILLSLPTTPITWHFEVVFDYGEYEIDASNTNPYQPARKWAYRPDPFSAYNAGFEVRTYRRCLHTLMFHRFVSALGENPVLVHATTYNYQTNTAQFSECRSITDTGYSYDTKQKKYTTASIPDLMLDYIPFQPEGHNFTLLTDIQKQSLEGLNEPPHYTLIDLYGEGIPGIMYNERSATYYREPGLVNPELTFETGPQPLKGHANSFSPEQGMRYGNWEALDSFPSQREMDGQGVLLQDLTGTGQLDVLLTTPGMQGYWEAKQNHTWKSFRSLPSWPAAYPIPEQAWLDVTGDGIADLVQFTANKVLVYPNIRKQGMGIPFMESKLPSMPPSLSGSPVEIIQFADMTGTGKSHLVRIRSSQVVYWPNLSYGRFGEPITMDNPPTFGRDFNPKQLFLADLDGSGTIDLIYLQSKQAFIYLNQSGNAFRDVIVLDLPVKFDNLDQITFSDIYGSGNECLVISESHVLPNPRYWCYDFCRGNKPYIINSINNNLGATTEITYGSSVDFYLADKQAGLPWITPLPFPVQVITQITHTDAISGSQYTSQYAYHHGYYDGIEREFRGFGRVDRQDTAYFPTSSVNLKQNPDYVAPSLSRTWYHTGACLENAALSRQYAKEYYAKDTDSFAFPDSTFDWNNTVPDGIMLQQAYVAMAGTVLRTEIYGLDDSPQAVHPYSVSESNFVVQLRQQKGTHPYAIFYVHVQQSLSYAYERNPEDPQIQQSCVLEVDAYGNVKSSCAIAYPRRNVSGALPQQQQLQVTCTIQSYSNQTSSNDYLLGVSIEVQSYEITTLVPTPKKMFGFATLQIEIQAALATLSPANPSSAQANLLGWERLYYAQVDEKGNNTILPPGQVTLPVLVAQQHVAEFSEEQITSALQGALEGDALKQKLEAGYYKLDAISNYWWNTGLTAAYFGLSQFYFSSATIDPIGNKTTYAYDTYQIFLTQATDALGNASKVEAIDYQHLHPMQLIDPNGNTAEIKLDPLGRVVYTSVYGHEAGNSVGFAPVSEAPTIVPTSWLELITAVKQHKEAAYVGKMQCYFYYDAFAWQNRKEPVSSVALIAEQYPDASISNRVQIHLSYNDGFGRTLCAKSKVEAGEAFLYDPITHQITTGHADDRWLTTGRVVYNNKGNPIKQYEPYFINTPDYITNPILDTFGVTSIIYYDPLDRVTHTVTAKGYLLTHTWTPWEQAVGDNNDNFAVSPYCQVNILQLNKASIYYDEALSDADRVALASAINNPSNPNPPKPSTTLGNALLYGVKYFENTYSRTIVDNLGHVIISEKIHKSPNNSSDRPEGEVLRSYYTYDILGRQLTSADPRLHAIGQYNFVTTYSLGGAALKVISADAGTRWGLSNTLGNPLWSYNERQITIIPSYDVVHRPTQIYVHKPATEKDTLELDQIVERFIYGDTPGIIPDPEKYNLRGQLYQHYDEAGLVTVPSYTLLGAPLATERRLKIDYKQEASWQGDTSSLFSLLQTTVYEEKSRYDALGRITEDTDVDNNNTKPTYYLSGGLNQVTVTTANDQRTKQVVERITYNEKGQRLSIAYGSTTTSTYSYDPKTWALSNLKTTNTKGTVLQDLTYVYDPVGNVIAKTDNGQNTVYYNNQEVTSTATYTYDSLYRIIQGSGREKIGNTQAKLGKEILLMPQSPHASDNTALQNYIEKYTYDRGNNLTQSQHIAQQDSWTRNMIVAETSNRAVIATINGDNKPAPTPTQVDSYFDVHGNQIQTQQVYPLAWNYRNNLQQATTIKHADGTQDAEYYVYDGAGQRIRKVQEQYGHSGALVTVKETLYLGTIEHRRTLQGTSLAGATVQQEYHSLRVMDDAHCVATRDHWVVGDPPSDFQNPSWRYHLEDYLGSCTVEVNEEGQQISYEEYTPFGCSLLFNRHR